MTDRLDLKTPDGVSQNIERIAALFPHCVTETIVDGIDGARPVSTKKIDFDLLRQELSADIVEGPKERYRLEWPGKREAIVTANMPTTNTLRPVREDSVNFDTTENLYIEGDNLEVLKLLQESYLGKIKMIDIDPPYNTGNDFVYRDNFAQSTEEFKADSGMTDELSNRLVANPETAGRYHSDWLTMMYPRLKLARNLLTDDGVIFIHIDDNEVHNLRKMCDEIFGEKNFIANIAVQINPRGRHLDNFIAKTHESILIYSNDCLEKETMTGLEKTGNMLDEYDKEDEVGKYRILGLRNRNQAFNPVTRPKLYYPLYVDTKTKKVSLIKDNQFTEEALPETAEGIKTCWTWGTEKVRAENKLLIGVEVNGKWQVFRKDYLLSEDGDIALTLPKSIWIDKEINNDYGKKSIKELFEKNIMDFPKSPDLIKKLILIGARRDSIILDFFSGSATTAHAVMQLNAEDGGNRKFIMVQLPEKTDEKSEAYKAGYKNICEIGKERIRRAGAKIAPSGSPEGGEKEIAPNLFDNAENAQLLPSGEVGRGLDVGFRVYRLDTSNMQDVYYRPQDYKQDMMTELFANHIKPDRTPDDLVAQVMLDWGLPLSLPIEQTTIAGKTVYKVADNALYCCFDEGIDEEFVRALVSGSATIGGATLSGTPNTALPLRIVFHDYAFANDTAKENVRQLLKQLSAETEMRVI